METLRRSVPLHKSDMEHPNLTAKQTQLHGLALWVPYFGAPVYPADRVDVYGFRSGMAPMTGLGYDTRRKDYDYALLRKLVAEWKQVAPNYYGDYWPLTAWHSDPDAWMAWQFDRPKEGEGVVQAFHELREPDRRILDRTAQVARLSVSGTSLFCGERPSPEKVAPTAGKRKPTMSKSHMIGVDDHYKLAYPCIISDPAFRNNWLEL